MKSVCFFAFILHISGTDKCKIGVRYLIFRPVETIWGSGEEIEEEKDFIGAIKIKITAEENFFSSFLKLPGCVLIDVQVCLKKCYPCSKVGKKGSLKFFLKKCGLDAKADMPYDEMWRIYSEAK
jgi:hypothetical protein